MEKAANKEVLEKVAKDILQTEDKEVIEAFISQLVYTSIINQ